MRRQKMLSRIFAAFMSLSLVLALACPKPAQALYVVSSDQAYNALSAGYEYLHWKYGDLPYDDDFANGQYGGVPGMTEFVSTIMTAPGSPFMLWVHNYVWWFLNSWYVQTDDDLNDGQAIDKLNDMEYGAYDFIMREWEIWQEKYPGAGGSSGGDATYTGNVYAIGNASLGSTYTFPDGTTVTLPDIVPAYSDAWSCRVVNVAGQTVTVADDGVISLGARNNAETFTAFNISIPGYYDLSSNQTGFASFSSTGALSLYGSHLGQGTSGSWNAKRSDPATASLAKYGPFALATSILLFNNTTSFATNALSCPVGFGSIYYFSNLPIYWGGELYGYDPGSPNDGPVGPTAPDYPSPETPTINNPTAPTIPLTFTDTGNTYTGSEADYSEYLQIIIDNQNVQIGQFADFAQLFADTWNAFLAWLDSEFDVLWQYLAHFSDNWNTLFQWQKVISHYLFSIDQQVLRFRNECAGLLEQILQMLYDIFEKMGARYSPTNPTIDPSGSLDITDPLWEWLSGVINNILSAIAAGLTGLVGTATNSVGSLSNLFPFSILVDLTALLTLLAHEPVAPVFDLPYPFAADRNAVLVHVDLSPWSDMVQSWHPMFLMLFSLGLLYLTIDMLMALYKMLSPIGDDLL